ncbi:hypothetical protein G4B88_031145 [Cannabis sativa]|uniref:Uncharacterized protein n=1 Tax=Cannabis sativa TaxID=3483 RepID=A0A7J6GUI4_CANSA|nr:hypothetical protein G4B88_031145 [Cannabis sativa]
MGEAQQVKLRIRVIRDVIVFQSLVATIAILVGNFTSNELSTLREEMNEFELGKVSYHDMAMSLNMAILAFVMLSNSSLQMDSLFLQSPSPILEFSLVKELNLIIPLIVSSIYLAGGVQPKFNLVRFKQKLTNA